MVTLMQQTSCFRITLQNEFRNDERNRICKFGDIQRLVSAYVRKKRMFDAFVNVISGYVVIHFTFQRSPIQGPNEVSDQGSKTPIEVDESSLSSLKSLTNTLEKSLTSEHLADEPDHIGQSDPKPIETAGNDHEEVLNEK